jgi:hypothetical protein
MHGSPVRKARVLRVVGDAALLETGDARVVDDDIETAMLVADIGDEICPLSFFAHIEMTVTRRRTERFGRRGAERIIDVRDVNTRTLGDERACNCCTDSAGGAGHERYLVLESTHAGHRTTHRFGSILNRRLLRSHADGLSSRARRQRRMPPARRGFAMPVNPSDRPIEVLRDETVDQLIMNYGHGKLSREAFERRLDEALDAKTHDKLLELTQDLDLKTDRQYTAQKKAELGIHLEPAPPADADDTEHVINVFAGSDRKGAWHVPRVIRVINVFGGADLDFSEARFTSETTYMTVFCLFGGVDIRLREGMRTLSKAVAIFGGVDNRAPSTTDPNAPLLVIEGFVLFGGVDIRVRKTPKERLREFADQLRALFETERRA